MLKVVQRYKTLRHYFLTVISNNIFTVINNCDYGRN